MIISTVVLFAILVGDAIGCSSKCTCRPLRKHSDSCEIDYIDPAYTCKCYKTEDCSSSYCSALCSAVVELRPPPCDCDKESDWNQWSYSITQVDYDFLRYQPTSVEQTVLASRYIPNCSGHVQTSSFTVTKSVTHTSSYLRTSGVSIQRGVKFKAGIPSIYEISLSSSASEYTEHKYGETEATQKTFSESYSCHGRPNKATECKVVMVQGVMKVPYTMKLTHKTIPNCICESKGIWTGLQTYNTTLIAKEMDGNCPKVTVRTTPVYQTSPNIPVQITTEPTENQNETSSTVLPLQIVLFIILLVTLCIIFYLLKLVRDRYF